MNYQHIEKEVEEELIWLWNYDSTNLSSNFPDMIAAKCHLQVNNAHDIQISRLSSIHRKRQIEKAYFQLPMISQRVLFAQLGWQLPFLLSTDDRYDLRQQYQYYYPIVLHLFPNRKKRDKDAYLSEAKRLYKEAITNFHKLYKEDSHEPAQQISP